MATWSLRTQFCIERGTLVTHKKDAENKLTADSPTRQEESIEQRLMKALMEDKDEKESLRAEFATKYASFKSQVFALLEAEREARIELTRMVASERSARVQAEEQAKAEQLQAEDRIRAKLAQELRTDLAQAVEEVEEEFMARLAKAMEHVSEVTQAAENAAQDASDRLAVLGGSCHLHVDSGASMDSNQKLHIRETSELRKNIQLLSEKVLRLEEEVTSPGDSGMSASGSPSRPVVLAIRDEIRKELQDEMDDMRVAMKGDFQQFRRQSVDMAAKRIDPMLLQGLTATACDNATPRSSFSLSPRSGITPRARVPSISS